MDDMLPIIGIVCALSSSCTSSISLLGGGGAAFAAWRARLSGAGDSGSGAPGTPPPRPPPRPQSQAPRSGKRIGRGAQNAAKAAAQRAQAAARAAARRAKATARAAARRAKAAARGARNAARAAARRTRAAARRARNAAKAAARRARNAIRARARKAKRAARAAARRLKKVFRRPRFRRPRFRRPRFRRRRRCFSPETLIKLQNGETRAMKNLELGDILINGSTVTATMQIKNESDPYYKIHSEDLNTDILVTGSHYIQSSGGFIRVSKFDGSVVTQNIDPIVICIITSDHKVPIGEYTFWDWEDQLVN